MLNEQLIEILQRVSIDNKYVILIDGETANLEWCNITKCYGIWVSKEGSSHFYSLSTLRILKNDNTEITISLEGTIYDLEIAVKQNINNL